MTQPLTTDQLEELLEAELPCGGVKYPHRLAQTCARPADLRSVGHGCDRAPMYKCINCWQVWYQAHVAILNRWGCITCDICAAVFPSVEFFSDYRPF